jgi:hypothetical protein
MLANKKDGYFDGASNIFSPFCKASHMPVIVLSLAY